MIQAYEEPMVFTKKPNTQPYSGSKFKNILAILIDFFLN